MKAAPTILTLTTDFGTADGYSGAMKGRILSIAPTCVIVDITHQIAPHQIWQAAWALRRAVGMFPPGSVHLAVVDPDVGSTRSGIVIETTNHLMVGPDNGVLTLAARDDGIQRIVEIEEDHSQWFKSNSFDGLTLFAPVAAHLAAGMVLEDVGQEAEDLVELPESEPARQGHFIEGEIVLFDHFGNAVTNITRAHLSGYHVEHIFLPDGSEVRMCSHYSQLAGGGGGAIFNSDDRLEIAVYSQPASERLHLNTGQKVRVLLTPP